MLRIEHFYWVLAGFPAVRRLAQPARAPLRARRVLDVCSRCCSPPAKGARAPQGRQQAARANRGRGGDRAWRCWRRACAASTSPKRPKPQRRASALRLGHRLFVPALLIPLVTVLVVLFGGKLRHRRNAAVRRRQHHAVGLALACVLAAFAAIAVTRERPVQAARRRPTPARHDGLGGVAAAGAGHAGRRVRRQRRRRRGRGAGVGGDSRRQPPRLRARLRPGHGAVHDDHGQRVRRIPGDDRRHRPAAAGPAARRGRRPCSARSACSPATAAR